MARRPWSYGSGFMFSSPEGVSYYRRDESGSVLTQRDEWIDVSVSPSPAMVSGLVWVTSEPTDWTDRILVQAAPTPSASREQWASPR